MKAAYFVKAGQIETRELPKPKIKKDSDALVRIVRACVCGSDLWWYRGLSDMPEGPVGHEAIGIVEEVGRYVKFVKPGDFVIVPFTRGCGHCAICRAGFEANCPNVEHDSQAGYQAEYLRVVNADGELVKIPGRPDNYTKDELASLTTLADVMPTGYHAAVAAGVKSGDTAVVFGDGAVGLCGVIAARLLGACRIILMSRHEDRAALGREFGATDIVPERNEEAVEKVLALTGGLGADAILECAGTASSVETAMQVARAGANIGRVGLPHGVDYNKYLDKLFRRNVGLTGGIASVAKYDKERLLGAILNGEINPGKVFTESFHLDQIKEAYDAMDARKAIKSLLILSD